MVKKIKFLSCNKLGFKKSKGEKQKINNIVVEQTWRTTAEDTSAKLISG